MNVQNSISGNMQEGRQQDLWHQKCSVSICGLRTLLQSCSSGHWLNATEAENICNNFGLSSEVADPQEEQ